MRHRPPTTCRQSDIEQHVLYRARRNLADLPGEAVLRLNPARDPSWPMTDLGWSEFAQLVDAARRLIGASRPLQASDLTRDEVGAVDGVDTADLQSRADAAVDGLRRAATALQDALAAASAGSLDPLQGSDGGALLLRCRRRDSALRFRR